ncbi:MAG: GNAT family N-acetyltransferase [Pseudomonadales bacterium]|nr:GNAT family N-acetyltransferase [Pseudomonadales bacterium]
MIPEVRYLCPSDADEYKRIRIEAARDPWFGTSVSLESKTPTSLLARALVASAEGFIAGAFDGDELVGIVGFGLGPSGRSGTLFGLYVSASHRRRGGGLALVRFLLEAAGASGIQAIELAVKRDNEGAISLYERLGFRVSSGGAGHDDAVGMTLRLPTSP